MNTTNIKPAVVGAILGLLMHHGLFIHGEWHIQAPAILLCHILCFSCLIWILDSAWWIISGYLFTLFSSICIYRLFFHRLSHFPGPLCARITKVWHMWKARACKNHLVLQGLRQRYGDFVRTGPSEITVFHPDVFTAIDGPGTECIKSEWYDLLHPNLSLVTARHKPAHTARRRQWKYGLNSKALDQYQKRVLRFVDLLDRCIEADVLNGRVSEVTDLFYWFGFDRMGDFVFNKDFGMLSRQKWHHIILLLQRALSILSPLGPVPWLTQIAFKTLPRVWILRDWFDMMAWCEAQMVERMKLPDNPSEARDVAHYLIQDAQQNKSHWPWLTGDSILAIVAGSEPTAAVLVATFSELARRTDYADLIRHELQQVDIRDAKALSTHCPHLEAVIAEALRLYPALPTGGNRKTSHHGVTIAGTFIPAHTTIVAPRFSISRREDCYERAREFLPERWYERPEMVRNKAAYAPFGTGHHSCLGRVVAMNDMRLVIARLVNKYTFRLAPGGNGDCVLRDLRDQFTSNPGRLRLVFELREAHVFSESV